MTVQDSSHVTSALPYGVNETSMQLWSNANAMIVLRSEGINEVEAERTTGYTYMSTSLEPEAGTSIPKEEEPLMLGMLEVGADEQ